jgi:Fibronectin type III-like domain/IclR helix-turn-helix domain
MLTGVAHAGQVLDLFSTDAPEWGPADVSRVLVISKSHAHYLLSTLASVGLLERQGSRRYRLGLRCLARGAIVRFTITNTGARTGSEVAEVYFGLPPSTGEPPKRLVGFVEVPLRAHRSATVDVPVNPGATTHPLGYIDTTLDRWAIARGAYKVYVGGSGRNTPLRGTFTVR